MPLDEAVASVKDEWLTVTEFKQKDDHQSEPSNNTIESGQPGQQLNYLMATNTNGPIVKIDLLNDKQQQQHQSEKKEAIEPNKVNERRRANALKNGHQNSIEQISNTGVRNRSTESIGHSKRDYLLFHCINEILL